MSWKVYFLSFVSAGLLALPQNIMSCGPSIDPYDYYTSFFQNGLANNPALRPFYYTGMSFLFQEDEPVSREDKIASEWVSYAGKTVSATDAFQFVNKFAYKDVLTLYNSIEKNKLLLVTDSVKRNSFSKYFQTTKDLEALGYLLYAKKIEPHVTSSYNSWDTEVRDSVKMQALKTNGMQLYAAAKKDFIRKRYAYQIVRLSFYNNQPEVAKQAYEQMLASKTEQQTIDHLAQGLYAGSLYRLGRQGEAAYIYSKLFEATDVQKIKNYLSFTWSVNGDSTFNSTLSFCKSDKERASVYALKGFTESGDALPVLKKVQQYSPDLPLLKTLAIREINKLEEKLLTPSIAKENGGKVFYYTWNDMNEDSAFAAQQVYGKQIASFFEEVASTASSANKGFYTISAAYTNYMNRDLKKAGELLTRARSLQLNEKEKDQLELTKLLVLVNEARVINPEFEQQILPSIEWLRQKAASEPNDENFYNDVFQWKNFYRNFFAEVMAKRYHQQGDKVKEVLSVGTANSYGGVTFMQDNMDIKDVEALYALFMNKNKSAFDQFMIKGNSIKLKDVVDFAGAAYLRKYDFAQAINWFQKTPALAAAVIDKDPFIDLLYDQEERLPTEKIKTTSLAFAKEMLRLQQAIKTDKINAAKSAYKYALGLYNMTYYGHAWELVEYYRSGSDGYRVPNEATDFKKEYYSAYAAEEAFKNAKQLFTDKNMQARCVFMMAKCDQKQIQQPGYGDFPDWAKYDAAYKDYYSKFKANSYFPELINQYQTTAFYKEAYSRCSYLRDFVRGK